MVQVLEFSQILNTVKANTTGADEISPLMIQYCLLYTEKYIIHMVNVCSEYSNFPKQWKISFGKPLPNITNPTSLNDLRIISILPPMSGSFERIPYNQMYC